MIVLLVLGLLLLGTAVVLLSRAMIVPRLRATDTLAQIGHYGFTGGADQEREPGFRGFLDWGATWLGRVFTDGLHVVNTERMQKTLIAAGIRQTTPTNWSATGVLRHRASSDLDRDRGLDRSVDRGDDPPHHLLRRGRLGRARLHRPAQGGEPPLPHRPRHARADRLLVVTVEAGLSLSAALQLAGERMGGPLGESSGS